MWAALREVEESINMIKIYTAIFSKNNLKMMEVKEEPSLGLHVGAKDMLSYSEELKHTDAFRLRTGVQR